MADHIYKSASNSNLDKSEKAQRSEARIIFFGL